MYRCLLIKLYQRKEFNIVAFVLALVIIGWLVAFALGAQAGFDNNVPAAPQQLSTVTEPIQAVSQNTVSAV